MENLLNLSNGFTLFGLEIRYYGITMALSYVLALVICLILCKKKKYNENLPYKLLLIAFPLAVIGGRLGYVIFSGREWTLGQILDLRSGGLMLYGGVLLALIGIWIYAIVKKQNVLKYLDLIAPCLIIAQALGRWGNFFNGEAYGAIVSKSYLVNQHIPTFIIEGMKIDGFYRQPTFLYESLGNFIGFGLLLLFRRYPYLKIGQLTGGYMVWYAILRFFIEGLRTDSLMLGSIRIAQLVSCLLFLVGIYLLFFHYRRDPKLAHLYQKEKIYERV